MINIILANFSLIDDSHKRLLNSATPCYALNVGEKHSMLLFIIHRPTKQQKSDISSKCILDSLVVLILSFRIEV